ncbi:hypothetical protein KY285_029733 [Solanum tuberosum]|nr:hypothetical protein KY289_029903 [Solanum tuberosum]KAH0654851.1 hypothetical protein KY285_029733 [Solanum tuberosum]
MKAKLINWGYNENATRVEVVMALLWKCFMAAKGCNSVAIIPVNIRQRIVPPFDENSFGKIKSAIGRIDGNYVEKIRGEDDSKEFPGGIEAWIVMVDQEMTLFEQDKELQDFTSLDAICDLN